MPDRSGRYCFCGSEGVQIVADKWVCSTHAQGQRTDIRCSACTNGKLVVRWEVAPKPIQIQPTFDDGPIGPLKLETYRFVTCSSCAATSRMPESVLGQAIATAKAEEAKHQAQMAEARAQAAVEREQRLEAERIQKEIQAAARNNAERLRLQREQARINAELERLAAAADVVGSQGRHVEVPDDE